MEEKAILNEIKNNPAIKQEEISILIGKLLRTIKSIMSNMKEKGLIVRKNGKKNGEWIIL